jgi:hypothetical protein
LVADPENRLAILDSSMLINNVFKDFKTGVQSIFESNEVIAQVHIAASISPPLKEIVSLKTSQLVESGILKRIFDHFSKIDFPVKPQAIGPQVLTIKHLSAGFVVICGLLVLCILMFAAEWLTVLMKHLFKHRSFMLMTARSKSFWRKRTQSYWRLDFNIFRVIWIRVKRFVHAKVQKSSNVQN